MTRTEKTAAFREMHVRGQPLVMPNPWDLGSAKVLEALGAKAMATTSAGHAFTLGLADMGRVTRDQALEHARTICEVVTVPVNGDLENGYGPDPATVADTVRMAAEAGLAGLSIEDTDLPGTGAYAFDHAVERIVAAAEAARAANIVLTARADGWLNRAYDADEAVRRCKAFAQAGAEVLYAPLVKPETVRALCEIGPAVNVLAAGKMVQSTVSEIGSMGASRISIGGSIARVTHKALIDAARAMLDDGDLSPLGNVVTGAVVDPLLTRD